MTSDPQTQTLLIIDDEDEIVISVQQQFAGNYEVHSARSLQEAYTLLMALPIQVVILDQKMSADSNHSFFERLQTEFPEVIPVGLVSEQEIEDGVAAVNDGHIYRYIIQPWNPTELATTINQAFERHRLLQQRQSESSENSDPASTTIISSRLAELERDNRQLRRVNAEANDLLRTMAHDLRNPLGAIRSVTELLLDMPPHSQQEYHEYSSIIQRETDAMLTLLNGLLDLQRLAAGQVPMQPQQVDIEEFIEDVVVMNEPHAEGKGIKLVVMLEADPDRVEFDRPRIRQVLDNLLDNAIRFSEPNTTVTIKVASVANGIEFSVIDQGPGIREDDRLRIFAPFVRGSVRPTNGERTPGLGLAVCRMIVEQHGGVLDVVCEMGKGSRFYFVLPTYALDNSEVIR